MEKSQVSQMYSIWDQEKQKNTQYIMNSISSFSEENTISIKLDKQQKSLPLADRIFCSGKRFVLIQNFCMVRWNYVSLIAYRAIYEEPTHSIYCCNMSKLKDCGCRVLFGDELKYMKKSNCFYSIYEQVLKIPSKEIIPGSIIAFECPIHIKGQITDDRSGFGIDGSGINKEYGHTSLHLYIIGIKVE